MSKILLSRLTIAAILVIAIFQIEALNSKDKVSGKTRWQNGYVITWDVQEYYMYLPATFIYHDPGFNFLDTMKVPLKSHYWVTKSPLGKWKGRFSIGMAIMYSPFFLFGDAIAAMAGVARDGFSQPYQFALHISGFVYALIGFIFLGLSLRKFYSDLSCAVTLLCIGVGTNLFYYSTSEGAMTHASLFCLCALFLYFTISWHQKPKLFYILALCLAFGLMVLIRPSNIIVAFIFLLYGIFDLQSLKKKTLFLKNHFWHLVAGAVLLFLLALPQMMYWKHQTGTFLYYSYTGERFFFGHPHIMDGFFSFRKGWLVYTPIMALALIGFVFLRRYSKDLFIPVSVYFLLNMYIVLSWWCWWYGGGFGLRAFIESYVFLGFPLAALFHWSFKKGWVPAAGFLIFSFICIRVNLFQSYQYREGMLHWDSMSKAAYKATFLKDGYVKDFNKLIVPPDYQAAREGMPEKTP